LDQEKAFDNIVHKFLFKVLEKFNFGPKLIKWMKILYHDLTSCIIVNNFISQPVKISRSVKQGCSLSPLLYVLCLEPFVRKVCKDKDFEGEPDASLPNKLIKYKNFLILLSVVKIPVLSSAKTEILHCSGEPGNFKPSKSLSLHKDW
jgi:hypothetical protein